MNGSDLRRVIGQLPGAVESLVGPIAGRLPGMQHLTGSTTGSVNLRDAVTAMKVLVETGIARPVRPDRLFGMGLAILRWGFTPAAGWAAGAAARPDAVALIDELGSMTFREVDRGSPAPSPRGFARTGFAEAGVVGLLMRNSRWMPIALSAVAKAGADAVLLNTGFGAEQLGDVHAARGHSGGHLRRGVRRALAEVPARIPLSGSSAGMTATSSRPHAARAGRHPAASDPPGAPRAPGDPHQRHHRHAEGRRRDRSRASSRPPRSCPESL